ALMGGAGDDKGAEQLEALRRRHDALERQLALRTAGYSALKQARQASPAQVAARLPKGAALVEWVKYDRFDFGAKGPDRPGPTPSYAALVLWRPAGGGAEPAVRFLALGAARPIDSAVHAWRAAVQRGRTDPAAERALGERVWGPLAKAVPEGTDRLF